MREFGWGRREWSEGKDGGWECGLGAGTWPEMDAGTVGPCLGSTVTELQNWALISTSKTASTFNVQRLSQAQEWTLWSPTTFVYILPSRSLHSLMQRVGLRLTYIMILYESVRHCEYEVPLSLNLFLELRHRSSLFR